MNKETLLSKLLILSLLLVSMLSSCTYVGVGIGAAIGNNKVADTYYFPEDEPVLDTMAKGTWIKVFTGKERPLTGQFIAKEIDTYEFGNGGMVMLLDVRGQLKHSYIELEKIKYITTRDVSNKGALVGGVTGALIDLYIVNWFVSEADLD